MYRLQKWFFDLLTPSGEYVYAYVAVVRLAGREFRSLTLHVARPVQGLMLTRSIPVVGCEQTEDAGEHRVIRLQAGEIVIGGDSCTLEVHDNRCFVNLRYEGCGKDNPMPVKISTASHHHILWRPLHLKYRVAGAVAVDDQRIGAHGAYGYVDYLECTYLPPGVPVRSLYWGRLHHPDFDLVYMHALGKRGTPAWSGVCGRMCGKQIGGSDLALRIAAGKRGVGGTDGYELRWGDRGREIVVNVRHVAPVQQGSFIDQQEFRSSAARSILKCLTRNPRGEKYLSSADAILSVGDTSQFINNIPMIDEYTLL